MIRLELPPGLSARERYGLDVLIDLSRLLIVLDPQADVVRLSVVDGPSRQLDQAIREAARFDGAPGLVRLPRAVLGDVTDLAGAAIEQAVTATDRHDRVPSAENPLARNGRERDPVVQRWAMALRAAVVANAGGRSVRLLAPWPDGRRWAVSITHDLDVVNGWPAFTLLRLAELARHGEANRAGQGLISALATLGRDPIVPGVGTLLDSEHAAGISSTWFVLSGTPSLASWVRGDVTYRLESGKASRLVDAIARGGHEIGLHGSFATAAGVARFTEERERLGRQVGAPPDGVRQHFLRMRPGRTQAAMQEAGFAYDATYGYPDRNGFRLGVADVVPAWLSEAPAHLSTVPLVWMDRALSKYRGIEDPDLWVTDALELAATCRAVEGLWVGLWHPNLVPALGFPGAPAAFRRLVDDLASHRPYFATLQRLVSWRRARRTMRARRATPDGRVELVTPERSDWGVALEDEQGRVVNG